MKRPPIGRAMLLVPLLLALAGALRAAGNLEAWLDRNQISLGETVQLVIQAEGRLSGEPDTSPLEKDFQLLGTSSGSSINIVNGSMSSSTTWRITLQPKRQGILTIPPLEIGGRRTEARSLVVADSPAPQADSGADLFIETEVTPEAPYERQQVMYQVRLFHAVQLAEGSLSAPQPANTIVQQLGQDRTYETTIHSRHYRVIERTYALFPQQAGKLTIEPPVFTGQVVEPARSRNPLGSFFGVDPFFNQTPFSMLSGSTRPVRITGQAATLAVRPRPGSGQGAAWLPAETVKLSEAWQPEQEKVKVGDAVTRTVTVLAAGQTGAALPELTPGPVEGFRIYPDQAEVKTEAGGATLSGSRRQKIAFIPTRPGTFTLPGINLQWWDVKADQWRQASLPPKTIRVLPGSDQYAAPAAPAPLPPSQPDAAGLSPGKTGTVVPGLAPAGQGHSLWKPVAATLGAAWLLTLLLWSRDRRKLKVGESAPATPAPGAEPPSIDLHRDFLAACESGDAAGARRSLLQLAARAWPVDPPRGLADLASRLEDKEAAREVAALDHFLFSAQPPGLWDGSRLQSVLKHLPQGKGAPAAKKRAGLPPLYP